MASKVFGNRDLKKQILEASKTSCYELTNRYTGCTPPFRYRNKVTGKVRDCLDECFLNVDKWLAPLLASVPNTYIMTKTAYYHHGGKRQKRDSLGKEESFGLTKNHHLGISLNETFGVLLMWWYIDTDQDVEEYGKEMKVYFPKSAEDAALYTKHLLHRLPDDKRQLITISLPNSIGISGYDLVFPHHPIWQRFAHLIQRGRLQFDFNA